LAGREAIALHVWQPLTAGELMAATAGIMIDWTEVDARRADAAAEAAEDAARRAREAGFDATPLAVRSAGPVWETIITIAGEHDAAVIIVGARGLSGIGRAVLGSVSERVARLAGRPVLVVHPRDAAAAERPPAS
jgi:nucleotide-binding universal stress UspA family protein